MQINKFQTISKFLSIFLKLAATLVLILLVFGSLNLYIRQNFTLFNVERSSGLIAVFTNVSVSDATSNWASSITVPISLASFSYLLFKTSYLFDYLAEGNNPFSYDFSQSLKTIGFLLVLYDLIIPLIYSIFINVAITDGYYFNFAVSSFFWIGLLLYFVSEVLNYGINLNKRGSLEDNN